jgi:hypothetical protein
MKTELFGLLAGISLASSAAAGTSSFLATGTTARPDHSGSYPECLK